MKKWKEGLQEVNENCNWKEIKKGKQVFFYENLNKKKGKEMNGKKQNKNGKKIIKEEGNKRKKQGFLSREEGQKKLRKEIKADKNKKEIKVDREEIAKVFFFQKVVDKRWKQIKRKGKGKENCENQQGGRKMERN